jgi:HEAT repeat protein
MPVGACSCGAVYAFDVTGHNLGTAMIEALVFGCNGDWDLAWDLLPEEDYLEKQVKHYDIDSHLIVPGGAYQGRQISGTLFFIRLHSDVREVTESGARRQLQRATPVSETSSRRPRGKKPFTKADVENLVQTYDVERLQELARQDKRLIRDLQRLLYAVDLRARLRAAELLGKACAVIAQRDPGTVSRLLQGLFTSLSDTAASSWGSLDAIGEIISQSPKQFAGYIPQIYAWAKDKELLPEVLRVLGRISRIRPDLIRKATLHLIPLLEDENPQIRGHAVFLLGNLGAQEAADDLKKLVPNSATFEMYDKGELQAQTVGQAAAEALEKL